MAEDARRPRRRPRRPGRAALRDANAQRPRLHTHANRFGALGVYGSDAPAIQELMRATPSLAAPCIRSCLHGRRSRVGRPARDGAECRGRARAPDAGAVPQRAGGRGHGAGGGGADGRRARLGRRAAGARRLPGSRRWRRAIRSDARQSRAVTDFCSAAASQRRAPRPQRLRSVQSLKVAAIPSR